LLSKRLKFISQLISTPTVVWDIGCDHGLLGLGFRSNRDVLEIHLVDQSIDVIKKLKSNIDSDIPKPKVFVHFKKGQEIKINQKIKNSLIIAGMGGKEILDILKYVLPQLKQEDEIIISPHRNFLLLREYLSQSSYRLVCESVVSDSGHFYQVLKLSLMPDYNQVSIYGDTLWQSREGLLYRDYLIQHFQHHRDVVSNDFLKFLQNLVV
jgi:tRNA (adenine22-N1)-methyltransferase